MRTVSFGGGRKGFGWVWASLIPSEPEDGMDGGSFLDRMFNLFLKKVNFMPCSGSVLWSVIITISLIYNA